MVQLVVWTWRVALREGSQGVNPEVGGEGSQGCTLEIERVRTITEEEIESQRTPKGGWTRDTLEAWGVPWPPPSGWKRAILESGIPYQGTSATSPARTAERKFSNKTNRPVLCRNCFKPMRRTGESEWTCDGCGLRWP